MSKEALGSVSSPLCGHPLTGSSPSYPKPDGELEFDPLEEEEVGLFGVDGEPGVGR